MFALGLEPRFVSEIVSKTTVSTISPSKHRGERITISYLKFWRQIFYIKLPPPPSILNIFFFIKKIFYLNKFVYLMLPNFKKQIIIKKTSLILKEQLLHLEQIQE